MLEQLKDDRQQALGEKVAVSEHNQQLISHMEQLGRQLQESRAEIERLRIIERKLEKEIQGVKNSSSWKLTGPLRKLRRTISN